MFGSASNTFQGANTNNCFSIILLHEKYRMRFEKLKRQAEARKRDPLAEKKKKSAVESGPET